MSHDNKPLSDGFEEFWAGAGVKQILSPVGFAKTIWRFAAQHNRRTQEAIEREVERDVLTRAIQRINSNPYSLTKDECVQLLRDMRDGRNQVITNPAEIAAAFERDAAAESTSRRDS